MGAPNEEQPPADHGSQPLKRVPKARWVLVAVLVLAVFAAILYFFHPMAPVFLLLSMVIQLPIIYFVMRYTSSNSYADRVWERKKQFEKDGDAAAWLKQEQREADAPGFQYWSKKGRNRNMLIRANLLHILEEQAGADALLQMIDESALGREDTELYKTLKTRISK